MQRKWKAFAILLLCAIILFITAHNQGKTFYKPEECTPVFSLPSGFYNGEIDVALATKAGWTIFYTLDSSDPRTSSNVIQYNNTPIHIIDASDNPNVYSMIQDVSLAYNKEEIAFITGEVPEGTDYVLPQYYIDKCTVIRAIAKKGKEETDIATAVYFIDYDKKTGYEDIAIISIVTDPENLFDVEKGIYVLGETWRQYKEQGVDSNVWSWWPGNFSKRHKQYEREAVIHYFSGALSFTQNIGIRIQGNSSRAGNPKSLNIYARERYGKKFFPDIFGNFIFPKTINLFSGSQDYGTKIRDPLINRISKDTKVICRDYIPCVLFLDGEYWGFYFLTEKIDEYWISSVFDVLPEKVVVMKNHAVSVGNPDDLIEYRETKTFLETADMTKEENYQKVCTLFDMDNLAEYYAIMIYINRRDDWPRSNKELWKTRGSAGEGYNDGKWRYILYDLNSWSLDTRLLEEDTISTVMKQDAVFANLCTNPHFVELFTKTMIRIMNNTFSYEKIDDNINYFLSFMIEPMKNNNKRFYGAEEYTSSNYFEYPADGKTFTDKVETIRSFLIDRRFCMAYLLHIHFGINYEWQEGKCIAN